MTAAIAIAWVSTSQLLRVRRTWALLVLAIAPALVFAILQSRLTDARAYDLFHEGPMLLLFAFVTPVVTLMAAAAAFGDERSGHTLSFLTVRPLPRWQIAAAKAAAAWMAAFAVAGAGGAALALTLLVGQGDASSLGPLLLALALNVAVYVAIFVPLGLVMRRAVLAGLAFVLIWELSLSIAISGLATFSVTRIGLSAYAGLLDEARRVLEAEGALGVVTAGAGGAVAKAVVLAALGIAVTTQLLRRRDLA